LSFRVEHRLELLSKLEKADVKTIDNNESAAYDEGLIDYIYFAIV
jgi:hypothetical protein